MEPHGINSCRTDMNFKLFFKWMTDWCRRQELDLKLKSQKEEAATIYGEGVAHWVFGDNSGFGVIDVTLFLFLSFCSFSACVLRFMDRWWHPGLWFNIVLDTAHFVSVTPEYRPFKFATFHFAVSGEHAAGPASTGCKGRKGKRPEKSRLEAAKGTAKWLGPGGSIWLFILRCMLEMLANET